MNLLVVDKVIVGALLLALGSPANAILIDFTSSEWSGVSGSLYTQTVAGVGDLTLAATGGSLTFNDADSGGCFAGGGDEAGLACVGDGIGIGDDEITNSVQSLTVTFSSAVEVIDIILLDLFNNSREQEVALITMNGITLPELMGGIDLGGLIITGISGPDVTMLTFQAIGSASDFALAAIDVAAVPVPGAVILFISGLFGINLMRRKTVATHVAA